MPRKEPPADAQPEAAEAVPAPPAADADVVAVPGASTSFGKPHAPVVWRPSSHAEHQAAAVRDGAVDRLKLLMSDLQRELASFDHAVDADLAAKIAMLKEILDA